jgi:hypothetical protein
MPRMRHPKVAGPYDAHEDQVPMLRMSGWLTDDEWTRAGLPEPPEPAEDETGDDAGGEPQNETPGEKKPSKTRARPRANSDKETD